MPTGDEAIPSEGPVQDDIDHDEQSQFMENNFTQLDATDLMEDLKYPRNKKLRKSIEKVPPRSRGTFKGEIT